MTQTEPVVFVVDDDAAMRRSLAWLLESVSRPVESFNSAEEFLRSYAPDRPGCLVLDVRMPGMSGLELQNELARRKSLLPIIIISGHGDVPMAVRAMKAGVLDFIEKPFNQQVLLERISDALKRDARDRKERQRQDDIQSRLDLLTAREREVMELVVAGLTSREIAERLGVSPKTVEVHRNHLMDKLKVAGVVELVRLALSAGPSPAPA